MFHEVSSYDIKSLTFEQVGDTDSYMITVKHRNPYIEDKLMCSQWVADKPDSFRAVWEWIITPASGDVSVGSVTFCEPARITGGRMDFTFTGSMGKLVDGTTLYRTWFEDEQP